MMILNEEQDNTFLKKTEQLFMMIHHWKHGKRKDKKFWDSKINRFLAGQEKELGFMYADTLWSYTYTVYKELCPPWWKFWSGR